jgi:hypothetical protein
MMNSNSKPVSPVEPTTLSILELPENTVATLPEINGYEGPEPTRYGDWEKNGRCIDF